MPLTRGIAHSPRNRGKFSEREERGGGRGYEQAVDELLVRPGERPQLGRQGEGEQEVGAGQQAGPLPVQPAPGLVSVTRGAVTDLDLMVPAFIEFDRQQMEGGVQREADRGGVP